MNHDPVITTTQTAAIPVRAESRHTWHAFRAAGEVPSVRKMHAALGGSYNVLTEECRMLRDEEAAQQLTVSPDDTPHDGDEVPAPTAPATEPEEDGAEADAEPFPLAARYDLPDRVTLDQHLVEAQAAVAQAKVMHDRLTAERETADLTLLQRVRQVRDLERRMVEREELLQEDLIIARRDRMEAQVRLGDLDALLTEQTTVIAQAEQAVTVVQEQMTLAVYNGLCGARAPLTTAVEQAMAALCQAVAALATADAKQHAAAEACGFADLMRTVPFVCPPTAPTHAANGMPIPRRTDGVVNAWIYATLEAVLPPPPRGGQYPPTFTDLQAADVAQTPLTWAQYQALKKPRRHLITHVLQPHRGAANYTSLLAYGIPALVTPTRHPRVSDAQYSQLLKVPQLMRLGTDHTPQSPPGAPPQASPALRPALAEGHEDAVPADERELRQDRLPASVRAPIVHTWEASADDDDEEE